MTKSTTAPALHLSEPGAPPGNWRVVVDSIGDADASLVAALKHLSPLPESHLATLLYQAPSVLVTGLERDAAEAVNEVLAKAGLASRVADLETAIEPGDCRHELALAVGDMRRMGEVHRLVIQVLGVDAASARKILCTSPTILLGQVSANTARDMRRRFAALDTEVIVSRADEALFDVFLGGGTPSERLRAVQALRGLEVELVDRWENSEQPLLAAGLSKAGADRIWERLSRTNLPVRVINRDFERFDVRLDEAPATAEMIDFLTTTTGMPEKVAQKVVRATPLIIHPGVAFEQMTSHLERIHQLGGRAMADLVAFQSFILTIGKLGDLEASSVALQVLAGLGPEEAVAVLRQTRRVEGPLTGPRARWLKYELERAGTESKMVLR